MLHYFLKIIFFILVIGNSVCADLPGQLVQLQGKLGQLKGKLGSLKESLRKLKNKLEQPEQISINFEQGFLPNQYYGAQAEQTLVELEQNIITNAETNGYGYKTANLIQLQKVCRLANNAIAKLNIGYTFAVPDFIMISSQQIQDFLKGLPAPHKLDLVQRWQIIINRYLPSLEALQQAIQNKKFPDGFLDDAEKLEHEIKRIFEHVANTKSDQALEDIITTLDQTQKQNITTLIAALKNRNEKLMVRSSGKEDTDKLANAGGNESIANVSPTTKDILLALGVGEKDKTGVVSSYFSAKSLTQRLGAGDLSLREAPFTPVVMQRMIGEKKGQRLPRCGVMFTEETEGAVSKRFRKNVAGKFVDKDGNVIAEDEIHTKARYRDENQKIKTSGISIIQAAFGHNEGVVNSLVTVDTYFVDNSGLIHPLIRQKNFRRAPSGEGKLAQQKNNAALVDLPVLEPQAVIALKLFASALEDYYKKPMDVEYVILHDEGLDIIYIVQARPIVHNPTQPEPFYLDLDHPMVKSLQKIPGQAIGVGGGTLQFIGTKHQVIIKNNIGEALATYQASLNPKDVKAILINEIAPATSHEATTFRSELKPVMSIEKDFEHVQDWSQQDTPKIILDAQQQFVTQWPGEGFNLARLLGNGAALPNWINYPLPQQVSVMSMYLPGLVQDIYKSVNQAFFGTDEISDQQRAEFKQHLKIQRSSIFFIKQQIKLVKTAREVDAQEALKNIWLFCNALPIRQGYQDRIRSFLHYAGLIITNLIPNLNIQPKNPDGTRNDAYLSKRLFPIHFLETLLFQHHHDVTGLYGDSVIKLWTQIRKENKGIEAVTQAVLPGQKIVPKDTFTKLAAILGQHALTDDLKTRWIQAVEQLDLTGKPMQEIFEIQKLTDQISSLQKRIDVLGKHANEKNNEFKKALQHDLNRIQLELGARSLSDADKQKAKFYQMLISLGKLDILELWLHTSFAQDQNISNLTNEVDNSKDFLDTLLDYKKRLQDVNLAGFEDPKTYHSSWTNFQNNIFNYFVTNFTQSFANTSRLGKLAALGVMEELVTKFDAAIKAVTGSTKFVVTNLPIGKSFDDIKADPNSLKEQIDIKKDKIFTFHLMLERYFELLQKWLELLESLRLFLPPYHRGELVRDIVNNQARAILSELGNKTNLDSELRPSPGFSVGGAVIGSQATWNNTTTPKTHEDFFTFCHQSLLVVIAKFSSNYGIQENQLPSFPQTINQRIKNLRYSNYNTKPALLGTLLQANKLTLLYNFPQDNHSATIKVIYNTSSKSTTIHFSMFGGNHLNRWPQCIDYAELKSLDRVQLKASTQGKGFEINWLIKKPADIDTVGLLITDLCAIASSGNIASKIAMDATIFKKIIELSADSKVRIHSALPIALQSLEIADYGSIEIDQLITITQKLFAGKDYALNSEIFFFRRKHKPDADHPTVDKAIFYNLTPENFYSLVGYDDIETYKYTNIRLLMDKLNELKKANKLSNLQTTNHTSLQADFRRVVPVI